MAGAGSIAGRVVIKGPIPKMKAAPVTEDRAACGVEHPNRSILLGAGGGVANAVVVLEGVREGKSLPETAPSLDQKNCEFVPRVQIARLHDRLRILNSDVASHNVHAYGPGNESLFNVATPTQGTHGDGSLERIGPVRLKCDVHPWMSGWIYVSENPHATVTGEAGEFLLSEVPPGRYEVRIWHEVLSGKGREVVLRAGEHLNSDLILSVAGD